MSELRNHTYTPAGSLVKLVQALGYLLSLDDNKKMNRVKLIKLLWAADRFHMRRYGRTVSESRYYAMPHGPVCSLALDIAQLNRDFALDDDDISYISEFFTADGYSTAMSKNPGDDYLSETDKEMMRKAYQVFNSAEDFDLADQVSHKYPEWLQYKSYFDGGERSSQPIDEAKFFENPDRDDYFEEDKDVLDAAREVFIEQREIVDSISTQS